MFFSYFFILFFNKQVKLVFSVFMVLYTLMVLVSHRGSLEEKGLVSFMNFLLSFLLLLTLAVEVKEVLFNVLVLFSMLVYVFFASKNLFNMFLGFESSLLPLLLLIYWGGYQKERFYASSLLIIYMFCASVPLLLAFIYTWSVYNTSSLCLLQYLQPFKGVSFLYFCLVLAFLVKMPMWSVHQWLPKAHVEACLTGSMMLAGVALKMSFLGLYWLFSMGDVPILLKNFLLLFAVVSMFMSFLMSMGQVDAKSFIAYLSISHMSLGLFLLLKPSLLSFKALQILTLSHGVASPGLFFLASVLQQLSGSRNLIFHHGLVDVNFSLRVFLLLMVVFSLGLPPSPAFFSEMMTLLVVFPCLSLVVGVLLGVLFNSIALLYLQVKTEMSKSNVYIEPSIMSSKGQLEAFSMLFSQLLFILFLLN